MACTNGDGWCEKNYAKRCIGKKQKIDCTCVCQSEKRKEFLYSMLSINIGVVGASGKINAFY